MSKARAVTASIRSTESTDKSSKSLVTDQQEEQKSETNESTLKKEEDLSKKLERRYHLLYLKAIEVQCLLENLLERRVSSVRYIFFFCIFKACNM